MTLDFGAIHYGAVATTGLATFFLGAVWYAALFGKQWQRLNGYSDEKLAEMRRKTPPPVFFGIMVISYLLLSFVVAVLVEAFGVTSAGGGAALGFALWLGPAFAIGLTHFIASDKPIGVYAIDWSYQLVYLVMTGAILGGWQ